ncbi:MAG: hypothetical protein IKF14_08195 [Atopobiaceae bacterium]|nr:hypothetical protein [Atopobiaceae bacterium]
MSTNDNKKPFETASATTDPDNSNSGPFAFIITGVCLAVLLGLGLLISSVASIALTAAASAMSDAPSSSTPLDDDFDFNDLDELFNQYYQDDNNYGGSSTSTQNGTSSMVTVDEALDFDLAPYGACIDDGVSASAYAGVPQEVRSFVRELVSADRTNTQKVVAALNEAALNDEARAAKVKEAIELSDAGVRAINDIALPSLTNDEGGAVADALGSAKTKAAERWTQMGRELRLLDTTDKIETRKIWNYDEDVADATEEAADLIEDAMDKAANL